jgi:hypothetical protein
MVGFAGWYFNWSRITGQPRRLLVMAPWPITIFGLFVIATAPALLRLPVAPGAGHRRLHQQR